MTVTRILPQISWLRNETEKEDEKKEEAAIVTEPFQLKIIPETPDGEKLVFVAIPKTILIEYGVTPPTGNLKQFKDNLAPLLLAIYKGLNFLHKYYKGKSLHTLPHFSMDQLSDVFKNSVTASNQLVLSIYTPIEFIPPLSVDNKIIHQALANHLKLSMQRHIEKFPKDKP